MRVAGRAPGAAFLSFLPFLLYLPFRGRLPLPRRAVVTRKRFRGGGNGRALLRRPGPSTLARPGAACPHRCPGGPRSGPAAPAGPGRRRLPVGGGVEAARGAQPRLRGARCVLGASLKIK